jgi:hypothetical protein
MADSEPPPGEEDPHQPRHNHYEHAAKEAVHAHPLPGEDLRTTFLDDAKMWIRVYRELLAFKETLIRDTTQALRAMSTPGRQEVERTDAMILEAEAQRFRRRLAMWETRCQELESEGGETGS